ncbi:autotransporter outer membrane beta-barrel domain-containing protein [Pseudomonas lini]
MNKVHRTIWNVSKGSWVVASEHASARGKCSGGSLSKLAAIVLLVGTAGLTVLPSAVQAASVWNVSSGDWTTAANWSGGIPTAGTLTIIGNGGTATLGVASAATGATGQLIVGHTVSGTLIEQNGSTLTSTSAILGNVSGVTGTMTVTGSSTWTNTGTMVLANSGTGTSGTLTIANGGVVNNTSNFILLGVGTGTTGTISVDGSGSTLTAGTIYIAQAGTGKLTVTNSATVTASSLTFGLSTGTGTLAIASGGKVTDTGNAILGNAASSTAIVTVDGSGSSFSVGSTLVVGSAASSTGSVSVTNGATATVSGNVDLADNASATGTMAVDGSGSKLTVTGSIYAGNLGTGTFAVTNGATVSSAGAVIANVSGSTGTTTVTGSGSAWKNSGAVTIGNTGTGTLSVADSGAVTGSTFVLGSATAGKGTLAIDGSGSSVTGSGLLIVGSAGVGTLSITSGADATFSNSVIVGHLASATGTVTLDGSGSTLTASGGLTVANSGGGTLTVSDGADVSSGGATIFGNSAGSTGTGTVDGSGSTLASSGELYVGNAGTGALAITNGAVVTGTSFYLGAASTSSGTLTVDGSGSSLTGTGSLSVGLDGTGQLTVTNGAKVKLAQGTFIANRSGSTGTVTVDGSGSSFDMGTGGLWVGRSGLGSLTVSNTASLVSNGTDIASSAASGGSNVLIESGATWTDKSTISVGSDSAGVITIQSGGQASSTYLTAGVRTGGSGSAVTVTGADSALTIGSVIIGQGGDASMLVADGASANMDALVAGNLAGVTGTVTVDGSSSTLTATTSLTVGNSGTGTLDITDNGVVTATGGVVVADETGSTGTVNITSLGELQTLALTGRSGTAQVNFDNGTLAALADNTAFVSGFTGTQLNIASGGLTIDDQGFAVATDNGFSGSGALTKTGSGTVTLSGANSYTGSTAVLTGTLALTAPQAVSTGDVSIAAGATYGLDFSGNPSAYTFDNGLTGAGLMLVDLGDTADAFAFGANTGSAFTGTVELGRSTFALSGDNTTALTNATLQLDTGNTTTVGLGTQTIGNLTLNGGTLVFPTEVPSDTLSPGNISTGLLTLASGTVAVTIPDPVTPPDTWAGTGSAATLLQQDDTILDQLISASSVSGSASNLTLVDQDGTTVTNTSVDIAQNGTAVAVGHYGYNLTTSSNADGLYVAYGLSQLDLVAGQTLVLSGDDGTTAGSELHALVTGSGNLTIAADAAITLNNSANSYTGVTTVSTGTLILGDDHVLGDSASLVVASGAIADINGTTQTVGALAVSGTVDLSGGTLATSSALGTGRLTTTAGASIDLAGGTLTIANGGTTAAGTLTGAGSFNLTGGTLAIDGANAGLSATTTIGTNAIAVLNNTLGLGSGAIADNGTLVFDGVSGTFANAVSGSGTVSLIDAAAIALSGDNSAFAGLFDIAIGATLTASLAQHLGTAAIADDGLLIVDTATDWTLANAISGSGAFIKAGSGTLAITANESYTGGTTITGGTLQIGTGGTTGSIVGDVTDNGTLAFNRSDVYTFAGTVSGTGNVTQIGPGTTVLTADNTYTGGTTIAAGTLQLGNGGTTGSIFGDVTDNGTLVFNRSDVYAFDGVISGSGNVIQLGSGTTVLTDISTYTGTTTVTKGTLAVGDATTPSAALTGGGATSVAYGATLGGYGSITGTVINDGTLAVANAISAFGGEANGTFTLNGTLINNALAQIGGSGIGNTLMVSNYVGNNGTLALNTYLGADGSPSDRLAINGGTATGTSNLLISNVGGAGALTVGNGILVVDALNGATTSASAFTLGSRVIAGPYEYTLHQGAKDGSLTENWYLHSTAWPSNGPNYRQEISLYSTLPSMTQVYGRELLGTLHQRVGEQEQLSCGCAFNPSGDDTVNGVWGRVINVRGKQGDGTLYSNGAQFDYKLSALQLGVDLYRHQDDDGRRDHVGVYGSVGRLNGNVEHYTGERAGSNSFDAYSLGAYATHYGASGWYVDSVLQGTWYENVKAKSSRNLMTSSAVAVGLESKGFGVAASLEVGYPLELTDHWILEPQAQVVYQRVTLNNASDVAANVRFAPATSMAERIGARLTTTRELDHGVESRLITPWVDANLWHESRGDNRTEISSEDGFMPFHSKLGGSWAEVGAGVTGQITRNTSVFAHASYEFGLDGDRQANSYAIGVRINW